MRQLLRLLYVLSALLPITACTKEIFPTPATTPQPPATATATVEAQMPSVAPTATATPTGAPLPLPLYFLSEGTIWLLKPGEPSPQEIAIEGEVSTMDVWPGDNRIAYGTTNGKVYTLMPGQGAVLLHNVQAETDSPVRIGHVSWSSSGTKLAYTVAYTAEQMIWQAGYPSYPSGLWVFDLEAQSPTWLLSNHYFQEGERKINQLRVVSASEWSVDDTALLLLYSYWEWSNYSILEPIAHQPYEANVYDLDKSGWGSGFWTRDGQAVLISGQNYRDVSDLMLLDRVTKEPKLLINGTAENLYVSDAQELSSGIVFLGGNRLYMGNLTEQGFQYAPVGTDPLCEAREPGHIEWDTTGQWGVLVCQYGPNDSQPVEIRVISLDGENINLTPFFNTLPKTPTTILWGSNQ